MFQFVSLWRPSLNTRHTLFTRPHGRWFTKEAVRQWDVPRHVGHGKVNSNCFDNSETITVSMATNVTVHMTQGNDLLAVWICCTNLHQSRRKAFLFESKQQCVASHWLNLSFYKAVNSQCNCAITCLRKFALRETLEGMILHCIMVSEST